MTQELQKTAALYARVSTVDQNCEVQLQDLRRFAGQRFAQLSLPKTPSTLKQLNLKRRWK